MNLKTRVFAALVSVAILGFAIAGCGGATHPACVAIDASESTRYALFDYTKRFQQLLGETAESGGSLAVVITTGDPLVESDIEKSIDFGGLTELDQTSERNAAVDEFARQVNRNVRLAVSGVTNPSPGSGIIAAIALLAGQGCASIEMLSDGLEAADVHMKQDDIVTSSGRNQLLDRLDAQGRLPDLESIDLHFPLGGYLPQGTDISKERLDAVPRFWEAYAQRANASLSWRQS